MGKTFRNRKDSFDDDFENTGNLKRVKIQKYKKKRQGGTNRSFDGEEFNDNETASIRNW